MKLNMVAVSTAVLGFLLASASASAVGLGFSNEPGSFLQFTPGGMLTFEDEVPGSFDDIRITASDGFGDALGLTGDIDGTFAIGPVSSPGFGQETASLSGVGLLAIDDGAGHTLTGDVSFESIMTFFNFGGFNVAAAVNLSNLSYTGANADLLALFNDAAGIVQASFTAPIAMSLSALIASGAQVGNYSGTIVGAPLPMPEPSAALCFAVGALVVGTAGRRWS